MPPKKKPTPKLPSADETESIFLSTLSGEEFEARIMPMDTSLYMYHVDNTDMCISSEDSSSDRDEAEAKDENETKVADESKVVDDSKPPAVTSDGTVLVAVKKEDVEIVPSASITSASSPSASTAEASTQTSDSARSTNLKVKTDGTSGATLTPVASIATTMDSPYAFSPHSTARSSSTKHSDSDSDSDPKVDKAELLKRSRKPRLSKKDTCPVNSHDVFNRSMMLAPPKKPISPQDVICNKLCDYCGRVGDECLNQRYGRFCIAYCYRCYCNNKTSFTQAGIVDTFKVAYMCGYDHNLFLKNASLRVKTCVNECVLPGCLESCSLIFAINMVMWEYMIAETERLARCTKKSKSKKSKSRKK